MIRIDDILEFIKNGGELAGVSIGTPVLDVIEKHGEPTEMYGDADVGYLHYNEIRFGYWRAGIDEIAIIFNKEFVSFNIDVEFLELMPGINSNTKLNEIIQVLNFAKIGWSSRYDKNNDDYMIIKTEGNVGIIVHLESGQIDKISYTGNNF